MGSPHHGRQPLGGFGQKNSAAAAPYSPIHIELTRDLLRQSLINHVNCSWAQDRWLFSSLSHPPRKQGNLGNLWWTLHQRVCVRDAPNRVLWWGAPTTGRQPLGGFGQKNSAAAAPYSPIHIELLSLILNRGMMGYLIICPPPNRNNRAFDECTL